MNEEERIQFLKKMGYGGSGILNAAKDNPAPSTPERQTRKERPVTPAAEKYSRDVDKQELLNLHRIFNQENREND